MNNWIRTAAACAAVMVTGIAVARGQMPPPAPVASQRDQVTLAVPRHNNAAPWVASAGRFVAVTWGAALEGKWDIYVATSADEGRTFGTPVRVNTVDGDGRVGGEIPPRVALHLPKGATVPQVVVAWNAKDQGTEIKIARSRDFGKTFAAPVSLQAPGAAGDRGWHALTIDAQGLAHVVWLDHRGLAEAKAEAGAKAGGAAAAPAGHASHEAAALDGVAMAMKSRLHYATYGERATPEQMLAPGVCYCCKTALAPNAKGVLATWRHVYDGNMRDMAFALLGAPGAAAAPPRLSTDGWSINGCPDDGPALAVDAGDRVHAIWPTVIPGDEPVGALFYASKAASAQTFGARQRITTLGSPKPSHPQVAVDGAGQLFVAWDEIVGGVRTAAWSHGTATDGALRLGAPERLAAAGPTQYPVMAPLARGVVVAWVSGAQGTSVIRLRHLVAAGAAVTAAR